MSAVVATAPTQTSPSPTAGHQTTAQTKPTGKTYTDFMQAFIASLTGDATAATGAFNFLGQATKGDGQATTTSAEGKRKWVSTTQDDSAMLAMLQGDPTAMQALIAQMAATGALDYTGTASDTQALFAKAEAALNGSTTIDPNAKAQMLVDLNALKTGTATDANGNALALSGSDLEDFLKTAMAALTGQKSQTTQTGTAAVAAVSTAKTLLSLDQTQPTATDAAQPAAEVAQAQLQQATQAITLARAQQTRSRLQATPSAMGSKTRTSTEATPKDGVTADMSAQTQGTPVTAATKSGTAEMNAAAVRATLIGGTEPAKDKDAGLQTFQSALDKTDASVPDQSLNVDPRLGTSTLTGTPGQITAATSTSGAVALSAVGGVIAAHAKAGNSEFNIKLDPAGLGQIDVKMQVMATGEVRAHLVVERADTLALLTQDQRGLQQQLDQAGFKTDPSSLQFSLRDQGTNQQGQQQTWRSLFAEPTGTISTGTLSQTPIEQTVYVRPHHARTEGVDLSV